MYPHERSLVKRLADQPFALIGINSDKDREKLKETMKDEGITWRSFWNGGSTSGPISTEWKVSGWPTLYVLDAEGVIRFKSVGTGEYEPVIDELLAQMEQAEDKQSQASIPLTPSLATPAPSAQLVSTASAIDDDPEEELQELIDGFDEARTAFREEYNAAETDEERKLLLEVRPQAEQYVDGFLALAERYAGTTWAARSLSWVLSNVSGAHAKQALDTLLDEYFMDEAMANVCRLLRRDTTARAMSATRKLMTESPHASVRGQACFALGQQLKSSLRQATDADAKEVLMAEYEALMERVVAEFADLEYFPDYGRTLGEVAGAELFEQRNLQIGMPVPEIEAEDVDGVSFKLSDYRGKVVMIDFWGHW